eukprot:COSAG04_NODE_44_length_31776_cov_9.320769_3_plen_991_part_00
MQRLALLLSAAMAVADPAQMRAAERRLQQQPGAQGAEPAICAQLAERGTLHCASDADLCPEACAAAAGAPPPPPTTCVHLAERGTLQCNSDADLCPNECSRMGEQDDEVTASATVAAGFQTSCTTLLELVGGCAHEISAANSDGRLGTRVSDVCPAECSGRGGCAETAVDVPFLGATQDLSGHQNTVELHGDAISGVGEHPEHDVLGDACVDGGGVTFSGAAHAEIVLDSPYATDATFSIGMWVLVAPVELFAPRMASETQTLYSHPAAVPHRGIRIYLTRDYWLGSWVLTVELEATRRIFDLDAIRGSLAKWTHVLVVVDDAEVDVAVDGQTLSGSTARFAAQNKRVLGGNGPLVRDTLLAALDLPSAFELGLDITPRGTVNGYANIFHVTATENDYGTYGDRIPGLWFQPGTRKLYITDGTPQSANDNSRTWGCDDDLLTLTQGTTSHVQLQCSESAVRVYVHGALACDAPRDGRQVWPDAKVYLSDHFVAAADAEVRDFYLGDISQPSRTLWHADGELTVTAVAPELRGAVSTLSDTVTIGADSPGVRAFDFFHGSVAMLQIYPTALSAAQMECAHESGRQLVQNGRMAQQVPSECRGRVSTGCTSHTADNSPEALRIPTPAVDDGSCEFGELQGTPGEYGSVAVTDSWQRVVLTESYSNPVVICGVITRLSTTQALVRVQRVRMDSSGVWSFDVRAEQKSCHFATPPPSREQVSYLVVEAGVSAEGWQAGLVRVDDLEWHRVSFLRQSGSPVVVSQIQTFDNRTSFLSVRNYLPPHANTSSARLAFFMQIQGEGIWCRDGAFYAEYFDSLDLSGNAVATQCEEDAPDWHWHVSSDGVPPPLIGKPRVLSPMLFSARWTTRINVAASAVFLFSSTANRGSRIIADGATVLDRWEECCSTFSAEPLQLSAGYHVVAYEYRSALDAGSTPSNSYAELSWSVDGESFGADPSSNSATGTFLYLPWAVACDIQTITTESLAGRAEAPEVAT